MHAGVKETNSFFFFSYDVKECDVNVCGFVYSTHILISPFFFHFFFEKKSCFFQIFISILDSVSIFLVFVMFDFVFRSCFLIEKFNFELSFRFNVKPCILMTQCISWFVLWMVSVFVFILHVWTRITNFFRSFVQKVNKKKRKSFGKIHSVLFPLPYSCVRTIFVGHLASYEIPLSYCLFIVYYYYHLRYTELYRFFFILLFIFFIMFCVHSFFLSFIVVCPFTIFVLFIDARSGFYFFLCFSFFFFWMISVLHSTHTLFSN